MLSFNDVFAEMTAVKSSTPNERKGLPENAPRRFRMHFIADLLIKTVNWGKGYGQIFSFERSGLPYRAEEKRVAKGYGGPEASSGRFAGGFRDRRDGDEAL
jgi:hypothetical protein